MLINNTLHIYKHLNFKAMKKFFSMMVAVAAMFTFAACGDSETPEPQKPAGKTQLEKPVVTVSNQTEDGFTLTWEPVANATEYLVYVNKDLQPKTTETTYTFSDLNAGTYKPRVKAIGGGNYKDSDYSDAVEPIVLTGATSVDWFTQTVTLPEDSDKIAAKGINSSNTFVFNWQGEGVESLSYTYYHIDELKDLTEDEIITKMTPLQADYLKYVNTAEGIDLQFSDLAGGQTYVLYALATKGGKEFLAKNEITTNATILTLGTQAWLGAWNASTPQIVHVKTYAFRDERTDFTLNIEPYKEYYSETEYISYSNYVWVDGFSVLGENAPAFGYIYHESVLNADQTDYEYTGNYCLDLMCYETIGELGQGSGIYAVWMPLCSKGSSDYTIVMGSFAGYTLTLNPTTGAVTCEAYKGTLSDNSPFEVKAMDVFGFDPKTNELYLMMKDEENAFEEIKAGGIQNVVKAAASVSALSKAPKAMKAASFPTSVVVAM